LRFDRPGREEAWSYNVLQRLTYLLVIFVLFPLMIWTGLAMSFGFTRNSLWPFGSWEATRRRAACTSL